MLRKRHAAISRNRATALFLNRLLVTGYYIRDRVSDGFHGQLSPMDEGNRI